ncbi:intron Large complex component GCFC2-like [Bufo gargarizans]|uniref:intron Large complex component GCFC2-like n=1 Tax=Bufo gargarizans TaxID=30331 RepID=UPI001CF1F521|nr:intron Large complex component GCFC2-like [Bufo gargarizans]
MFRKPNRNLRVRRASSSENENEEDHGKVERPKRAGGRGLTCATKKRAEAAAASDERQSEGEEDAASADPSSRTAGLHSALSFSAEKEGEDGHFKIKKPTVNAVIFKVQKKTENAEQDTKPQEKGPDVSSESEESERGKVDVPEKEEYSSPAGSSPTSSPPSAGHLRHDDIPDAKQIRAARTRRKLARTQGDYISLDASHERSDSSQSESDDELDDHEKRIQFAPGMKNIKEQMAEEIASSSGSDGGDEEEMDDIQDKWEELQIRKAIKCPQTMDNDLLHGHRPTRKKKFVAPKFSSPPVTVEDIRKRLTARIASIDEVHRAHILDSERYTRDLENARNTLQKLETSSSEKSYKFFKSMKVYVENFVDCLNEKIQEIYQLESEMSQILEGHSRSLLKRRQDDLQRESAAIQKLAGTGNDVVADEETKSHLQDMELRRERRRQKREDSGQIDHHEGMSSDDELSLDQEREYKQDQEDVLLLCKPIFDDVHEDFCQTKNILSKFHEWREQFPETYYDAYISLCIPKLLGPLVRKQLIGWNPLQDATELEHMSWYCDLDDFCYSKHDREDNMEDNPNHKVLSAVIEKTVIPIVSGLVERVWDPMSSAQTRRLVDFCKTHVLGDEKSKPVQGLLSCLISRLKKAIEEDVFIPLYAKRLLQDRTSPHSRFQERQFWSAVKLFGNILLWDGFLQEEILQELGLDKLLNRYLLLVLLNAEPDSELVDKCHKIVEYLPQSWFRGLSSGETLTRLGNFSKHLVNFVHALHKLNDRKSMEVLVSLLLKIKAENLAEDVVAQYSIAV